MKRLILLRHAEAQPTHLAPVDRDRPLALAGLQQLEHRRRTMQDTLKDVDFVFCSNSRRTRQTLEALRASMQPKCETEYTDTLYQATSDAILKLLAGTNNTFNTVLVVGHNPGLSDFLSRVISVHPSNVSGSLGTSDIACFAGNFATWSEVAYPRLHVESVLRS